MFNRKWFHKYIYIYIYIHIHIYIVTPKKIEKSCNTILVGMLLSLLDLYRHVWLSDGSILFYMFGGFKHLLFFSISYMGMSWSQLTNSYFSRWVHCTTNQHRSCTIIHANLHFSTSFYIFGCYYPTLYGLFHGWLNCHPMTLELNGRNFCAPRARLTGSLFNKAM